MSDLSTAEVVIVRFGDIEGALFVPPRPAQLHGADGSSLGQVRGTWIDGLFAAEFLGADGSRYCSASCLGTLWRPDRWRITGQSDDAIAYLFRGGPPSMSRRSRRGIDYRATRKPTSASGDHLVAFVRDCSLVTIGGETVARLRYYPPGWRRDAGWGVECSSLADSWHRRVGLALTWIACCRLRRGSE